MFYLVKPLSIIVFELLIDDCPLFVTFCFCLRRKNNKDPQKKESGAEEASFGLIVDSFGSSNRVLATIPTHCVTSTVQCRFFYTATHYDAVDNISHR